MHDGTGASRQTHHHRKDRFVLWLDRLPATLVYEPNLWGPTRTLPQAQTAPVAYTGSGALAMSDYFLFVVPVLLLTGVIYYLFRKTSAL
jgi:hypothetical protein